MYWWNRSRWKVSMLFSKNDIAINSGLVSTLNRFLYFLATGLKVTKRTEIANTLLYWKATVLLSLCNLWLKTTATGKMAHWGGRRIKYEFSFTHLIYSLFSKWINKSFLHNIYGKMLMLIWELFCNESIFICRYWCSTKVDNDQEHVAGQGNWGFCRPSCPPITPTSRSRPIKYPRPVTRARIPRPRPTNRPILSNEMPSPNGLSKYLIKESWEKSTRNLGLPEASINFQNSCFLNLENKLHKIKAFFYSRWQILLLEITIQLKKMGLVVNTWEQDLFLGENTQTMQNCLIKLLLAIRTNGAKLNMIVEALWLTGTYVLFKTCLPKKKKKNTLYHFVGDMLSQQHIVSISCAIIIDLPLTIQLI